MAKLTPVDHDPFADVAPAAVAGKLVPVDHDPFADAAPAAPGLDLSKFGSDWKAAKAAIDQLPEELRGKAREHYADLVVAKERTDGGIGQTVNDYVRRAASSVPALGSWADEANAYTSSLFGGDYDMAHAYEQAQDRAIDKTETTKLGTLPMVGDVTTGGLTKAAGTVAGAVALPFARVAQGAGAIPTAINVGTNAAVYSGMDSAGRAQDGNRLEEGAKGAAVGLATGAPLGAVMGKVASRGAPRAPDEVAEAASRIGVDLPRVAATGDGVIAEGLRGTAAGLASIPFVGSPIPRAASKAVSQMDDAAVSIASKYADDVSAQSAGGNASDAMSGWIKSGSSKVTERLYEKVADYVPASAYRPLQATRRVVDKLGFDDVASASTVNQPAIGMVAKALDVPGGLTFPGLLKLRTNVGAMIDDGLLPNAGTVKPALKQIYAGLSRDLEDMATAFGGTKARNAWQTANRIQEQVALRREALTKVIGRDASRPGEDVVDRIVRMAGTKSSADGKLLLEARKAAGPAAWDEVSAAAVHRLGRNQSNEFSPAIFLKGYGALDPKSRSVLFGSTGKGNLMAELDDLATVASKFKNLEKLRNTSGTGRVNALLSGGAATAAGMSGLMGHLLTVAVPSHIAARMMASPVKVKAVSDFSKALYAAASGQAGTVAQSAIAQFAAAVAEETGEDEKAVADRIAASLEGKQ